MPESALLGLPPVTEADKLIYKALAITSPLLLKVNPHSGDVPHEDRAPGMIAGTSVAIFFVIVITCTRLWVRKYRTRAFGVDDMVIIPAAIGCVAYLSLTIATEAAGCLGEHIYDCTYEEYGWFWEVSTLLGLVALVSTKRIKAGTLRLSHLELYGVYNQNIDCARKSQDYWIDI